MPQPLPPKPIDPPTFDPATEAEIAAAAEITPEDIARARQAWRRDAAPDFRDLLDAAEESAT
jgi:acyl-CoA reductase-like NAD-dependent aldehyde dehydrogenase